MPVQIQQLNLADLLAKNQQLDMGRYAMAKADRDEQKQQRLSDALSRFKYGTPEYIESLGQVDPSAATGVQNAVNIQGRQNQQFQEHELDKFGQLAAAAVDTFRQNKDWEATKQALLPQLDAMGLGAYKQQFLSATPEAAQQAATLHGKWKNPDQEIADFKAKKIAEAQVKDQYGSGADPYYQPVDTDSGLMTFNARKGTYEPAMAGGQALRKSGSSPELQQSLSAAKTLGKGIGEAQAGAETNLGKTMDQADYAMSLLDELTNHPGKADMVGAPSVGNPVAKLYQIPGSNAAGFKSRLDQIQGQNFLQAFQTLKGGGQITEIEGKKATDAIARLSTSQSEAEFDRAANELKGLIARGVMRAQKSSRGDFSKAGPQNMATPSATIPPGAKVQRSKSTGKTRYSTDGGQTWTVVE